MAKEKLMTGFPPVSTEQWEQVINADLKGADYRKKLIWQTGEGFEVRPYYRAEDLAKVGHIDSGIGEFPFVRGVKKCAGWRIHQTIGVTDYARANAEALKMLDGGADSIGFCFKEAPSKAGMAALLKGIHLPAVELVLCGKGLQGAVPEFLAYAAASGFSPDEVRFSLLNDPLINELTLKGGFPCLCAEGDKCFDTLAGLIKQTEGFKHVRVVAVQGQRFQNCGSTLVQELAFSLSAGHEYLVRLMERGLSVDAAARSIRFTFGIGSNYFMEIAKLRAARMLWANIVKAYNPEKECSSKMRIHAVTSKWNMTLYDPYVNMLRGTTEAMSAAIAGVHSLEVLPFDEPARKAGEFSSRIARNAQLLLKHESHFDVVADPSGGSYYIENLTQSIANEAWKLFNEAEAKGGYIAAFHEGFIQEQVEASAAAKDKAIATRRLTLLGTNQYPNFTETVTEQPKSCCCGCSDKPAGDVRVLKPYRGAEAFEELRRTVDASGRNPKAFMLTCGSLAFARARSQFACNFFACAGIRVEDNTFFASVEEGAKAALASKAEIVVLCASDDDYAELAPKVHHLLGGKAILVVAGAPACQSELEQGGINHFISVRSNVLETLRGYVKELNIR